MKSHTIKVEFTFFGTVDVEADTREEAAEIVDTDFGLNMGEVTTGLYEEEIINWDMDMIPAKRVKK